MGIGDYDNRKENTATSYEKLFEIDENSSAENGISRHERNFR